MKKVTAVVLNYKVRDLTVKCVESLKQSTLVLEIIVVDNNSGDGVEEEIKKLGVEFIQTGANLGYTGGNNIGIKKALKNGSDLILILNPDTVVDKNCLKNLIKGMEETGAGIVGPKIYFRDKSSRSARGARKTIWYAGGKFDRLNVIGQHRGVDEKDSGQYDQITETDFVTGAAILVDKKVFDQVGFFDEKYFLYYEDLDFCERAKKAGIKVAYISTAVVYHENAKSTGLGSPLQDYYITRNRMLFAKKFLPFRTQFALFREALKNLGNPVRRLALWDFITRNFGKGSLN